MHFGSYLSSGFSVSHVSYFAMPFFFLAGDFWAYSGYVHVYIVPHADCMLFTWSCVTVEC